MPRSARIVIPGVPHHLTHRGNNKQKIFRDRFDYLIYLALLRRYSKENDLKILCYCLMPNHIHLIAIPEKQNSMAKTIHKTHMRFTQIFNQRYNRCGHLWQGRYYSGGLDDPHLVTSMIYVEQNPLRSNIASSAWNYPWSSAKSHISGYDNYSILELDWWQERFSKQSWRKMLSQNG